MDPVDLAGCTALPRCGSTPSRRRLLRTVGALAALAVAPMLRAQARYPVRPVRLVVPFPAGTSPDVIARLWGERFSKATGQAVVVENRPGAGTVIAAQAAAAAPADGYTLFWTVNNTFSINPFVYRSLPYKLDDFVPVTRILSVPFVLIVSAESKIRSLDELVRESKARPGALTYASRRLRHRPEPRRRWWHDHQRRLLTPPKESRHEACKLKERQPRRPPRGGVA